MLKQQIRCREISEADIEAIAALLTLGFNRSREYWLQGLRRQAVREVPQGYPRFGYMLDSGGVPVGALLLLYGLKNKGSETTVYCNLSSWYVEPAFRNYAPLLTKVAQKNKEVTYINISAARWTWPIIETQGFRSYCNGLFFSIPAFSLTGSRISVETVSPETPAIDGLSAAEVELLNRHARYGCLSLICRTSDGKAVPFILQRLRIRKGWISVPAMQLIYCRDIAEFVQCAGPIGRRLLSYGRMSVVLDANGRVPGLLGLYAELRGRKYFKGPHRPRLADLTDTELVLYGP